MDFFSKYCTIPSSSNQSIPKPEPITKEQVIEHFTTYIDTNCIDTYTTIKYEFPSMFSGLIDKPTFWLYILQFLKNDMQFIQNNNSPQYSGILYDSDYHVMRLRTFYIATSQQGFSHGEYFMQNYIYNSYQNTLFDIQFVAFRIFKN